MTTQVNASPSRAFWKRIVKVLRGEGLRGVLNRVRDHRKTDFAFHLGYWVICPLGEKGVMPENPLRLVVEQISEDDPGILSELLSIYGPPYTEDMLLTRWQQQRLLGFVGRVAGEAVSCVWANPGEKVLEFGQPVMDLAADEVYFKDAWTKPAWRGKSLYPLTLALSGRVLEQQYGKTRSVNFIMHDNHASLNAYRKLGSYRKGYVANVKLFRKKFTLVIPGRTRTL